MTEEKILSREQAKVLFKKVQRRNLRRLGIDPNNRQPLSQLEPEPLLLTHAPALSKKRARARVRSAVQHGTTQKPAHCEYADCRRSDYLHAHHPDYDFPHDVIWLCAYHHRMLHRTLTT